MGCASADFRRCTRSRYWSAVTVGLPRSTRSRMRASATTVSRWARRDSVLGVDMSGLLTGGSLHLRPKGPSSRRWTSRRRGPRMRPMRHEISEWVVVPSTPGDIDAVARHCRRLVTKRALLAAGVAALPVPGLDWLTDVGVLVKVLPEVNQAFGLTEDQIER